MSDNQFEGPENLIKQPSGLLAGLRNSFLTGLVVIAPVALTIWLIWSVIGWIDGFVLPFILPALLERKDYWHVAVTNLSSQLIQNYQSDDIELYNP